MQYSFPGYYEPSSDKLDEVWQNCVFVFDTNMLLNIYRYSTGARESFFEVLDRLESRLWIPHQVALEYHDRRIVVISEQVKAYDTVIKILDNAQNIVKKGLEVYKKRHAFIDPTRLTQNIIQAIDEARSDVRKAKRSDPYTKQAYTDPLHEKIGRLFDGKIGKQPPQAKLREWYQEAEYRFQHRIPPGYHDERQNESRKDIKQYGDVILWLQLVEFIRETRKFVLFVTDDVKDDWWLPYEESQGPLRPRPELIQEMYTETGMFLWMYTGYAFMKKAREFLKLDARPDVVKEIKEVAQDPYLPGQWERYVERILNGLLKKDWNCLVIDYNSVGSDLPEIESQQLWIELTDTLPVYHSREFGKGIIFRKDVDKNVISFLEGHRIFYYVETRENEKPPT